MGWAGRGRMTFKGSSEAAAQKKDSPAGFGDRRRRHVQRLVSGGSPPESPKSVSVARHSRRNFLGTHPLRKMSKYQSRLYMST